MSDQQLAERARAASKLSASSKCLRKRLRSEPVIAEEVSLAADSNVSVSKNLDECWHVLDACDYETVQWMSLVEAVAHKAH